MVALCRAAGGALQEGRLFRAHQALQRLHADHFQDWARAADQARCDPLPPHMPLLACTSYKQRSSLRVGCGGRFSAVRYPMRMSCALAGVQGCRCAHRAWGGGCYLRPWRAPAIPHCHRRGVERGSSATGHLRLERLASEPHLILCHLTACTPFLSHLTSPHHNSPTPTSSHLITPCKSPPRNTYHTTPCKSPQVAIIS